MRRPCVLMLAASLLGTIGCGGRGDESPPPAPGATADPEVGESSKPDEAPVDPGPWTEEKLHAALREKNIHYTSAGQFTFDEQGRIVSAVLAQTNVSDISPLKGQPIVQLSISATRVQKLDALAGMPLEVLEAAETNVSDLSPLKGAPLRAMDLFKTRVSDLSPLNGAPLEVLLLDETLVADLSPLKDAKLVRLRLNSTKVSSIEALKGMPLEHLNLFQTKVSDLSPLKGAPLSEVWLNETPVEDISALRGAPLITLTLHRTPVRELGPLADCTTLERLHIGETEVTDLGPVLNLPLTRLIFTPSKITRGLQEIRGVETIREIGTTLEGKMSPLEFWPLYDEGKVE